MPILLRSLCSARHVLCVIVVKILVKFDKGGKGGKLNAMHGADMQ